MENRIDVKTMKSQLDYLIENGYGDKPIFVGEFYIGNTFNVGDRVCDEITYDAIHYSDVELTDDQQERIDVEVGNYIKNLPQEDKDFINSLDTQAKHDKQVTEYIRYLDSCKKSGRLNEEDYQKFLETIH